MPFLSSTWIVSGLKFGSCGRTIGQRSTYLVPIWHLIAFCVRHCSTTCPQFCLHLIMTVTSIQCLVSYSVCLTTQTVLRYLYKYTVIKIVNYWKWKFRQIWFFFFLFSSGSNTSRCSFNRKVLDRRTSASDCWDASFRAEGLVSFEQILIFCHTAVSCFKFFNFRISNVAITLDLLPFAVRLSIVAWVYIHWTQNIDHLSQAPSHCTALLSYHLICHHCPFNTSIILALCYSAVYNYAISNNFKGYLVFCSLVHSLSCIHKKGSSHVYRWF